MTPPRNPSWGYPSTLLVLTRLSLKVDVAWQVFIESTRTPLQISTPSGKSQRGLILFSQFEDGCGRVVGQKLLPTGTSLHFGTRSTREGDFCKGLSLGRLLVVVNVDDLYTRDFMTLPLTDKVTNTDCHGPSNVRKLIMKNTLTSWDTSWTLS